MFAICIESSHQKGMGHLFRALNFISFLRKKQENYVVIVNDDDNAKNILTQKQIPFETADVNDVTSNWESRFIEKHKVNIWINDRLDTDSHHSQKVKDNNVLLVAFDDDGSGSALADINFGLMPSYFQRDLKGKSVKKGMDYFILNEEIDKYKWERKSNEKILVTLGGSDTYGVTVKIAKALISADRKATIIIGPSFQDTKDLFAIAGDRFEIKQAVPSLIEEFYKYDLAITGGGITPFEANASGLPCIIIANEPHEMDNGKFLEQLGSSVFIGFYEEADLASMPLDKMNVQQMSVAGLKNISTKGAENIYNTIKKL